MDIYAKWFTKMALIYLVIGAGLGMTIAGAPSVGAYLRFTHVHLNLLGFMTMMIAGVAYHVLPRFNARPVPWPDGVKYHFLLHNIGLVGMVLSHLAEGLLGGEVFHGLFVLFAVTTAGGLFIMVYNLFGVLLPEKKPAGEAAPRPPCQKPPS